MNGLVAWFTGLPSSGKTTLARATKHELDGRQIACCVLDGDQFREILVPAPGYDEAGRDAFYSTLGSLAALLAREGLVVLVAATAHVRAYREKARSAAAKFVEIYVDTPLQECERRDRIGLYRRARAGEVKNVPGIDLPYEAPEKPSIVVHGVSREDDVGVVVETIASQLSR